MEAKPSLQCYDIYEEHLSDALGARVFGKRIQKDCSSPVKFEQFEGDELMDAQVYCAKKSQNEAFRGKLKSGYF